MKIAYCFYLIPMHNRRATDSRFDSCSLFLDINTANSPVFKYNFTTKEYFHLYFSLLQELFPLGHGNHLVLMPGYEHGCSTGEAACECFNVFMSEILATQQSWSCRDVARNLVISGRFCCWG